ncbi:hypothetical protein [Rothia nasimurium]|uniref:hypothetical protein n=1 Tax=Rothia nasimurium TaxID=85336 RepID=UPI003BA34E08
MISSVVAAANAAALVASEEGHKLELFGIPTWWFAIFGFIFFGALFFITISFSGRGIVRPDHAGDHLSAEEADALRDYQSKHKH